VSLTIAELIEKVWRTPVVKLAHYIGVSDVAASKACRRAGIPFRGRGRGRWAKSKKQHQQPERHKVQPKLNAGFG
jgi:hypothetical protein